MRAPTATSIWVGVSGWVGAKVGLQRRLVCSGWPPALPSARCRTTLAQTAACLATHTPRAAELERRSRARDRRRSRCGGAHKQRLVWHPHMHADFEAAVAALGELKDWWMMRRAREGRDKPALHCPAHSTLARQRASPASCLLPAQPGCRLIRPASPPTLCRRRLLRHPQGHSGAHGRRGHRRQPHPGQREEPPAGEQGGGGCPGWAALDARSTTSGLTGSAFHWVVGVTAAQGGEGGGRC